VLAFEPRRGSRARGGTDGSEHDKADEEANEEADQEANEEADEADRWNRAPFEGEASQHPRPDCSFVQNHGRLTVR
jgi:hypothetical protein